MKAQTFGGTSLFDNRIFTGDGEFVRSSSPKAFAPPKLMAEAGIAHWFSRGWHRSARDLSDFLNPGECDFTR